MDMKPRLTVTKRAQWVYGPKEGGVYNMARRLPRRLECVSKARAAKWDEDTAWHAYNAGYRQARKDASLPKVGAK